MDVIDKINSVIDEISCEIQYMVWMRENIEKTLASLCKEKSREMDLVKKGVADFEAYFDGRL